MSRGKKASASEAPPNMRIFQLVKITPLVRDVSGVVSGAEPIEVEALGIEVNDGLLWLRISDTVTRGFVLHNIFEVMVVRVQEKIQ